MDIHRNGSEVVAYTYESLSAYFRAAAEKYFQERGHHPSLAIALDTKGPEIRTGLLEGDDGKLELTLEKGATIKIVTNDEFKEKCTKDTLWVDYKNIPKVLVPGQQF